MLVSYSYALKGAGFGCLLQQFSELCPEQCGFKEEEKKVEFQSPASTAKPNKLKSEKVARKVYSDLAQNFVPSLGLEFSPGSKELNEKIAERIPEHAYMRIQLFALTAIALSGVAVASDPNKSRVVEVGIGRAYLQFGKGSRFFHAAHSNASAGFKDNWKVITIDRICEEKDITPKTMRILRCKGFTDEELEKLKVNSYALEAVSDSFKRVWPKERAKPDSLLAGTYLEQVLNSTITLPRSVNLFVDKAIEEALRPFMEQLYAEIMHGKITVEAALDLYCWSIKDKLSSLTIEIDRRRAILKKYEEELEAFFEEQISLDERRKNLKSLIDKYKEMRQNKLPEFKFVNMRKNKEFIKKSESRLALEDGRFFDYFLKIQKNKDELVRDAVWHSNNLLTNREFCVLENDGTIVPPLKDLIGSEEPASVQKDLLSSSTPLKKKRRMIASKVGEEE